MSNTEKVLALTLAVGFTLVGAVHLQRGQADQSGAPPTSSTLVPGERYAGEVVAVVLVSSTCAACQLIEKGYVDSLRAALASRATAAGRELAVVGVAIDHAWDEGISFLEDLGAFDEVVSGRSWLNAGAEAYMHRHVPGPLSVPQILVFTRDVEWSGGALLFDDSQVVARVLGIDGLWDWRDEDFRLRVSLE